MSMWMARVPKWQLTLHLVQRGNRIHWERPVNSEKQSPHFLLLTDWNIIIHLIPKTVHAEWSWILPWCYKHTFLLHFKRSQCYPLYTLSQWKSDGQLHVWHHTYRIWSFPIGSDLALVQYFLTMPPSLPFGKVMYILCHCMVEVCSLLFDFTRGYNEDSALIVRRDHGPQIFKLCWHWQGI